MRKTLPDQKCYQITIALENDAFVGNESYEVMRIIRDQVFSALEHEEIAECIALKDINGNFVGYASLKD